MSQTHSLQDLGWGPDFLRQLGIDEIGKVAPLRVTAVHRDRVETLGEAGAEVLTLPPGMEAGEVAVGDWVLADETGTRIGRLFERKSLLHRRAAGDEPRDQLIGANLDTLFITTSMNDDFNIARLERFLALALDAEISPVLVLTKADLCDDPTPFHDALHDAMAQVPVVSLDAREPDAVAQLADWCGPGQTVAFVGSSGVGKSTLVNSLTGEHAATQSIREDDAKGRHTTTSRSFHALEGGGWLIDTPGMRAVRLVGVGAGIDEVFADVAELAQGCRFSDCAHDTEPGCAVKAAVEAGVLDAARVGRWQKLKAEDARHGESLAQAHARDRAFGRMVKGAKKAKKSKAGGGGKP